MNLTFEFFWEQFTKTEIAAQKQDENFILKILNKRQVKILSSDKLV
jgi:hypothetical protein